MIFEDLLRISQERQEQKENYDSTQRWSGEHSTDLLGICGEKVVSNATGLPMDTDLKAEGDPGYDFLKNGVRYDVKATKYKTGHLLEFPDKDIVADFYILVYVNIEKRFGKIIGWATGTEVEEAEIKDFGYGPRRAIAGADLHSGLPKGLQNERRS